MISPVRWQQACPLRHRHLQGMRRERGVAVDHATTGKHHPAGEIVQGYGGTGSPGDQARHPADARVQSVSGCAANPGADRGDGYATDALRRAGEQCDPKRGPLADFALDLNIATGRPDNFRRYR